MRINHVHAVFSLTGFVLLALPDMTTSAAEVLRPAESYTHLVYIRMRTAESGTLAPEIVLHQIDPLADASSPKARRIVSDARELTGGSLHSIENGQLLVAGYMGKASFVDLQSGEHSIAAPGPAEFILRNGRRGSIIFTMPQFTQVRQYDVESKATVTLLQGSMQRSKGFATHLHSRIALSPSGNLLATGTFAGSSEGGITHQFEVHIVDLQQNPPWARRLERQFTGGNVSTGGGNHVYAPAMYWQNDGMLLIAAPTIPDTQQAGVFVHDKWKMQIHQVDLQTLAAEVVCDTPIPDATSMTSFDPDFWVRSDGVLMIRSRAAGDHRIDLAKKKVVADRRLSPSFELRGDAYRPSLWAGKKELESKVNVWDISVSPDGRQIAWMVPLRNSDYGWTQAEKKLFLYSENSGVVAIGKGRFHLAGTPTPHPVLHPSVHWLADEVPSSK